MRMENSRLVLPQGCKYEIVAHPSGADRAVEVALFQDHRFAFFFWLKWRFALGTDAPPPLLVSLDWHEDLASPCPSECDELTALQTSNLLEVALFCWQSLNPGNDGHILAAACLDLIGDIYVVRKQNAEYSEQCRSYIESFLDVNGKVHRVRCFSSVPELMKELMLVSEPPVFFDVDLDYCTDSPDPCGGGKYVRLVPDCEVKAILDPNGELMTWLFSRMAGMTIATEPEFCGGLINSNHLLSILSDCLFHPQLLGHSSTWKHLRSES